MTSRRSAGEALGSSTLKGDGPDAAGQSYVVFGGGAGFPARLDLTQDLTGGNGFQINGVDELDDASFNGVVGIGDFNGDGFDDLLIGARGGDPSGVDGAGEAYIIFGQAAAFAAKLELSSLDGTTGFVLQGIDVDDRAAEYLGAAGDVNADGYDDILIGARRGDALDDDTGEAYLIFGGPGPHPAVFEFSSLDGQNGIPFIGTAQDDFAGRSVGSAQDVNGDGFDDFLITASGFDANGGTFVIFGTDFTGAVTHLGDGADNTLAGDANANSIVGGRGNDTLIGAGGGDVLRGGQGDDVLAVADVGFRRVVGGNGFDTLRIDSDNITLDLTAIPDNRITGIERIDATPGDLTKITLSHREVLNLSDTSNTLLVRAKASDTITIGSGWTNVGTETINGELYTVFTQGAATLKTASLSSIILSNDLIAENTDTSSPVTVGDLKGISGQTSVFSLVAGAGDNENSTFQISGNLLQVKAGTVLDFETTTSYRVRVRLVDGAEVFEEAFVINVIDVNEAPTDIKLSASTIVENTDTTNPVAVGNLAAVDVDAAESHVFALVAGTGGDDNGSFQIAGNSLQVKSGTTLNHELQSSYLVRVRATDSGGFQIEKEFTITVTDANDQPTDILLDNNTVAENADTSNAVVVGKLTGVDEDAGDTHAFLLVAGAGSTDNGAFQINGSNLEIKPGTSLDHELQGQYSIRVRATDQAGLSVETILAVNVTDVNESPTSIALSSSVIGDGADTSAGPVDVSMLAAVGDPDDPTEPFGMHTFTLIPGVGSGDNAAFQITGGQLQLKQGVSIDRQVKSVYSIRVRADDGDNTVDQSFTLDVIPVLILAIAPGAISELDGMATATITRQIGVGSAVLVTLSSNDTSEATVPASIMIPANQSVATFPISAQDDNLLDGTQTVTITASIEGFEPEFNTVDVTDFEQLVVAITDGTISVSGSTTATVTRTDPTGNLTVNLSSDDTTEATVVSSITILDGQLTSAPFSIDGVNDAILDGVQTVTIHASADDYVDGSDTLQVTDFETLVVTIADAAVSENAGATTATVTRTDPTGDLTVNLSSDDTSEATVVASIVIPAGQLTSAPFPILTVDDTILDGSQTVTITAQGNAYFDGSDTLVVTDYEPLVVDVADAAISENGGATTGTVTRTDPTGDLTVNLLSSDTSEATVVASVVISAGQLTSLPFPIDAVDDAVLDGTQIATITASATGYVDGSGTLDVTDFEQLVVVIDADAISENGGTTTATVRRTDPGGSLTVNLVSNDTSEATVIASIVIPAGQLTSLPVAVDAVDDAILDGTQTVTVTASAAEYADGSDTVDVTDFEQLVVVLTDSSISEFGGETFGTVTRTDPTGDLTVNLVSNDTSEATLFATSVLIPDGQLTSPPFAIGAVDDAILDGTQTATITASAPGHVDGSETVDVTDFEQLVVAISADAISENGGITMATVTRIASTGDLTVSLASDDPSEATVLPSIVIPDGQLTSAPFSINGVDDAILDGTQTVRITASANEYFNGSDRLDVIDFEQLAVTISDATISENGGTTTASVTRTDPSGTLLVSLSNSDAREATFPTSILILDGQLTSSPFPIGAVDDALLDGTQTVTVTASASGHIDGSDALDVTDFEQLVVAISVNEISENGGTANATVRRTDPTGDLTVSLSSDDTSEATVANYVTIPDGQLTSLPFSIDAVDDDELDGTQTVTVTAAAPGYISGTGTFDVADAEQLVLAITDSAISENGGVTMATVSRTVATGDLTVNLVSDDTTEATLTASVVIPSGQLTSLPFPIHGIDDSDLDGTQAVTITASAEGHLDGTSTLQVTDFENLTLSITVGAISENGGTTLATVTRTDPTGDLTIDLSSDDTSEATVIASIVIASGQVTSQPFSIDAVNDTILDGTQTATITAAAEGYIAASDTVDVTDYEPLVVTIVDDAISENGGATTVTVTRTDPSGTLVVNLLSDDPSEATVVASVVIPDGQVTSAAVAINAVDDDLLDGTQTVTLTASAPGYIDGSDTLDVTDYEPLVVSIADGSISENGGVTTATVSRTVAAGDLTVQLMSDDTSEANLVASIVIPDGQLTSAPFDVVAVDDLILDGTQTVLITASAADHIDGSHTLEVTDFEILRISIADQSISENGGVTTATVTRTDPNGALTVSLLSDDTSEASVAAIIVIPDGQATSLPFSISAVDDAILDGTQTVTIRASAEGYVGAASTLDVTDFEQLTVTVTNSSISENGGATTATVTRTDSNGALKVSLSSGDTSAANVEASIVIPDGELVSAPFAIDAVDDAFVDGAQTVVITAAAADHVAGSDVVHVTDFEQLIVSISDAAISENGGTTMGTVTRTDPTSDLTVSLRSEDTSEATVVASIIIPSGQTTSSPFPIQAVDDSSLDGTHLVTISASAAGHIDGNETLALTDFEQLVVSLADSSISENGGSTSAVVTRTDPTGDLTVNLLSGDTNKAILIASVVISDGQNASPAFTVAALDNSVVDGIQTVAISAAAAGYVTASEPLEVTDFEQLIVTMNELSISENGGATTATVTRTDPTGDLTVSLSTSDLGEATVPPSIVIPAGQTTSPAFVVLASDDNELDGTQNVTLGASAIGYVDGNQTFQVSDFETLTISLDEDLISEQGGTATATITRSNLSDLDQALTVFISTNDVSELSVPFSVVIPPHQSTATFTVVAVDDRLLDGTQTPEISVAAPGYVGASRRVDITDHEILSLAIEATEISELQGTTTATVSRSNTDDLAQALTVDLLSNDTSEITLPVTVLIPAGAASATFDIVAQDDTILDGSQSVGISASAAGFETGLSSVEVTDHEALSLVIATTNVSENGGGTTATIARSNTDIGQAITVSIATDHADELNVPATVTLDPFQTSATFPIAARDDDLLDGTQIATVTASSTGYVANSASLEVTDFETLTVILDDSEISENQGLATATVTRSNTDTSQDLVVHLLSDDPSEATVPTTVTIPASQMSTSITVTAVDDDLLDGAQLVTILARADGYEFVGDTLSVKDHESLALTLAATTISENQGTTLATISRGNRDNAAELHVDLSSSDTSEATVPTSVTIPAGSSAATFAVTAVDDDLLDGSQNVLILAQSAGYVVEGSGVVEVTDHETLTIMFADESISEAGGSTTATVTRSDLATENGLLVALSTDDGSETGVPASVLIPSGQASATFTVMAFDDHLLDGTQTVMIAGSAPGYFTVPGALPVTDHEPLKLAISNTTISEQGGRGDHHGIS